MGHISSLLISRPSSTSCLRRVIEMTRFWVGFSLLLAVLGACDPIRPAAAVRLSSLGKTLVVTASAKAGQVLQAGEDTITVSWSLNATAPAGSGADFKTVEVLVLLCYAPASEEGRVWRSASDDLSKDKSCQFKITQQPYGAGAATFEYTVARDIPTASYYVRAYALDESGAKVAYGQTAPGAYFDVAGITGATASIRIAAGVCSAFSVVALAFFLLVESRKKNK